jgi:quercetin 2,3-dioxygenase
MAAGRGIVHSEMPVATTGDFWGFQLWINLPAKDKMIKPRFQDILTVEIPSVAGSEGGAVRVLAGHYGRARCA